MRSLRDPNVCQHYLAVPTGTTEARELLDHCWAYSTAYKCPSCGASFIETHQQVLESDPTNLRRIVILSPSSDAQQQ
jgi:hypothetical protein